VRELQRLRDGVRGPQARDEHAEERAADPRGLARSRVFIDAAQCRASCGVLPRAINPGGHTGRTRNPPPWGRGFWRADVNIAPRASSRRSPGNPDDGRRLSAVGGKVQAAPFCMQARSARCQPACPPWPEERRWMPGRVRSGQQWVEDLVETTAGWIRVWMRRRPILTQHLDSFSGAGRLRIPSAPAAGDSSGCQADATGRTAGRF
jgi:hypothetical protein